MPDDAIARIRALRNGELKLLVGTPPLLSSAHTASWRGLLLELHVTPTVYRVRNSEAHTHLLHFYTAGPVDCEWHSGGRLHRTTGVPGSMALEPVGSQASITVTRRRPDLQWVLALTPSLFAQRVRESLPSGRLELTPVLDLRDPQIQRLVTALQADVEAGSPAGSLFGESIGAALALHLAHRYSIGGIAQERSAPGMPKARLNRVLEWIAANLERDIHLGELASVAGMSASHFSKLFRKSTGMSPHRYILSGRVELAKKLLHSDGISVAEASLRAGFTDQSHLTNVFRRVVGVTPARYRMLR